LREYATGRRLPFARPRRPRPQTNAPGTNLR
jgi:hypothetical protein